MGKESDDSWLENKVFKEKAKVKGKNSIWKNHLSDDLDQTMQVWFCQQAAGAGTWAGIQGFRADQAQGISDACCIRLWVWLHWQRPYDKWFKQEKRFIYFCVL